MTLLRRHLTGETIEELSVETGIPEDGIQMRIQAAALSILTR